MHAERSSEPASKSRPKGQTGITVRKTSKGVKKYRAEVWDNTARKLIVKTHPTLAAAKSWRSAMQTKVANGEAYAVRPLTFNEASSDWMAKAESGAIRTRGGTRYKPSTLRAYAASMRLYVLPKLGDRKLSDIRLKTVQELADDLADRGLSRSSISSHLDPVRVVFKDAQRRELAYTNPVVGVQMAGAAEKVRDRIASPSQAVDLLASLDRDRALWATAFYAGLRCGELMALDWSCVDLAARRIRVERNYDPVAKEFVGAKSKAGNRTVPFPVLMLPFLTAEDRTQGLVFGPDGQKPFGYTGVRKRALRSWATVTCSGCEESVVHDYSQEMLCPECKGVLSTPLVPITLHECRHTYASLMLAAGVDMTRVSKRMGHSSITITVDRYGHLLPGDEADDMDRFGAYHAHQLDASGGAAA